MTFEDLCDEVARWSFMPGWSFTVRPASSDYLFAGVIVLHASVPDVRDPAQTVKIARSVPYALDMGTDNVGHFLRSLAYDVMCHEADEWLKCDGVAPFNPHQKTSTDPT